MSNRTDFHALSGELAEMFGLSEAARERIETELHDAYVAGEEGHGCRCQWCVRPEKHVGHRLIEEHPSDVFNPRRGCLDCDVWIDPVKMR